MASTDERLIQNSLLFISVRGNTAIDEKLERVQGCIEEGADVNAADGNDDGNTPLHMAARRGEPAVARLLVERGAHLTATNWSRLTPLDLARTHNDKHDDIINFLETAEKSARRHTNPQEKESQSDTQTVSFETKQHLKARDIIKHLETAETLLREHYSSINNEYQSIQLALTHIGTMLEKIKQDGIVPPEVDVTVLNKQPKTSLQTTTTKNTFIHKQDDLKNWFAKHKKKQSTESSLYIDQIRHATVREIKMPLGTTEDLFREHFLTRENESTSSCNQTTDKTTIPTTRLNVDTRQIDMFGQLYKPNYLNLVLLRAITNNQIRHFIFGINIKNIGNMNDVCLRYQLKGQKTPVVLFVQVKHAEDSDKDKLSVDEMQNNGCSLQNYFKSYLTIKDRFRADNENPIFEGKFNEVKCHLAVYTTVEECSCKKKTYHTVSENIHHLISTREHPNAIQYDYDESDVEVLNKLTVMENIKKLGVFFVEFIMSDTNNPGIIMGNKLIARYHVVMARKVLEQSNKLQENEIYRFWKFRPDFFESDCDYTNALKQTLFKELKTKCYTESKTCPNDLKNIKLLVKDVCPVTLSKLIGRLVTYNDKTKKLQLSSTFYNSLYLASEFETGQLSPLLERFHDIEVDENVLNEAIKKMLLSLKLKLPLSFGNLDMNSNENYTDVDSIINLLEKYKDSMIINISDDDLTTGQITEENLTQIKNCLGSAIGNLLIFDAETKMLKFNMNNKILPNNAADFLKKIKEDLQKPVIRNLCNYRFKMEVKEFPKASFLSDKYDNSVVRDFLSKLFFYSHQAGHDELKHLLQHGMYKNYDLQKEKKHIEFKIDPCIILLELHSKIQSWWMLSNEAPYLDENNNPFRQIQSRLRSYFKVNTTDPIPARTDADVSYVLGINSENNVKHQSRYLRRNYFSGLSNQLLSTKLLSLMLLRMITSEQIENFLLGTNIQGIGNMDDICLRYRVKNQTTPVVLFVQVIDRQDKEKTRLTEENLWSPSDYTLLKYFDSYIAIKSRFRTDTEDPIFEGDFSNVESNFVIHTTVTDRLAKKKIGGNISKHIQSLISTRQNTEAFQYDYNKKDIESLTKMTALKTLNKLSYCFLEFIMSKTFRPENLISSKLIMKYHVALARQVLQQIEVNQFIDYNLWKFRPEFFESDCEYLIALKKPLVQLLATKCLDKSEISKADQKHFHQLIDHPCPETISKLIGKLVTYDEKTKTLQIIEMSKVTNMFTTMEFMFLKEQLANIKIDENTINNAVQIKLTAMVFKLPSFFGNLDMTFRGSKTKVEKRIKVIANKVIDLLLRNEDTNVVSINDDDVGCGKLLEQGIFSINGGIGSAVGNLLTLDTATNLLKFELNNDVLPNYAALFLKQLKYAQDNVLKQNLSKYRFKFDLTEFPKITFAEDECDIIQATDFLNKLYIYCDQARPDVVEQILKQDIDNFFTKEKDAISVSSHVTINPYDIFLEAHNQLHKYEKNGEPFLLECVKIKHFDLPEHVPETDFISKATFYDSYKKGVSHISKTQNLDKCAIQTNKSHYLQRCIFKLTNLKDIEMYPLVLSVINYMYITKKYDLSWSINQETKEANICETMYQVFCRISSYIFRIYDPQFIELINTRIKAPYFSYLFECREFVCKLTIHPDMDWAVLKMTTIFQSGRQKYEIIARAGIGRQGIIISRDEFSEKIYSFQFTQ